MRAAFVLGLLSNLLATGVRGQAVDVFYFTRRNVRQSENWGKGRRLSLVFERFLSLSLAVFRWEESWILGKLMAAFR